MVERSVLGGCRSSRDLRGGCPHACLYIPGIEPGHHVARLHKVAFLLRNGLDVGREAARSLHAVVRNDFA